MSDKNKTLTISYLAHEYQRIGGIKFVGCDKKFNYKVANADEYEDKSVIIQKIHTDILRLALGKIEKKVQNNELYICCSSTRRADGNGSISLFLDKYTTLDEDSKLNGIIGRVSIDIVEKRDWDEIAINRTRSFDSLKVVITFVSRCDSKLFVDNSQSHFLSNKSIDSLSQNPFHKEQFNSFFAKELLTYGDDTRFSDDIIPCDMDSLFDFLLIDRLFVSLREALIKGAFRTYRQFENNDDRPKGSLDVSRHIKLNAGKHNGCVAYRYRENTINNYLNILIAKTYSVVRQKYPNIVDRLLKKNVGNLKEMLDYLIYETDAAKVSLQTAIMKTINPISHPYYCEYETVRKLCLRLLKNQGVSVFDNNDDETNSFLYYIPDLWEEFLNDIFVDTIDFPEFNKISVNAQFDDARYIEHNDKTGYMIKLRPDFVFCKNNKRENKDNPIMILDAKFIPSWGFVAKNGYYSVDDDVQKQIKDNIDECFRYKTVFKVNSTGVVFPMYYSDEKSESGLRAKYNEINICRKISSYNADRFYVIPFLVPQSINYRDYNQWRYDFNTSMSIFKELLVNNVYFNELN